MRDTILPLDLQNILLAPRMKGVEAARMSHEGRQGFATIQQGAEDTGMIFHDLGLFC
ncbi:hypothetical protein DPMN_070551 [Dreissena polymorpha]|uniref:Uncharacterized protein n=1 Tax=Dreissena polymorpha TaxID=45954 RepID=A0A9D3Z368_DREPO|nr:hypothetical protein DPMN_070551 [Dreissena polymorpha]